MDELNHADRSELDFVGRCAIVSGGSSGIGLATALRLARLGAGVVVLDLQPPVMDVSGAGVRYVHADVTCREAVPKAFDEAEVHLSAPADLLVVSAGRYTLGAILELTEETWLATNQLNVMGALFALQEFRRRLPDDMVASSVLLSSAATAHANTAEPYAAYAATKAAVVALARQAAAEWAPSVRVNVVSPGLIKTPMLKIDQDQQALDAYLEDRVPVRRVGTAEEVASVITFLLSSAASYVTGADVPVDGGLIIT